MPSPRKIVRQKPPGQDKSRRINHAVKTFGSESDHKNRNWKCSFFLAVPFIPLSSPISEQILRIRNAIPISRTDGDIGGTSFDYGAYEMLFFMLSVYRNGNLSLSQIMIPHLISLLFFVELSLNFVILTRALCWQIL